MSDSSVVCCYNEEQLQRFFDVACKLVIESGDLISVASEKRPTNVMLKSGPDVSNASAVLTETDKAVERYLVDGLRAEFPDHAFIGEENMAGVLLDDQGNTLSYDKKPTWIIDPIDGTMNFVHSNPIICTSVALAINRRIMIGIINAPLIGYLYTAQKGKGAFVNDLKRESSTRRRLSVSDTKRLSEAMIIMEMPAGGPAHKRNLAVANVQSLLPKVHALRTLGPSALDIAWVAAGSADGFFIKGVHSWDMAAGSLLVHEAGGVVIDPSGEEFDLMSRSILVASTPELAFDLISNISLPDVPREFKDICPI